MITQLCFSGQGDEAIRLYCDAFGYDLKTLTHYEDTVSFGWEKPDEAKRGLVYHSELVRDGTELRVTDLGSAEQTELTRRGSVNVQFEPEEEVIKAFDALAAGGTVIRRLEKLPFLVIIGEVRDRFGVHWVLMCDYK